MYPTRRPFTNLPPVAKQNLLLAVVVILLVLMAVWVGVSNRLCANMGIDYCAYWTTGRLINQFGYSHMYDLQLLANIQKTVYPQPFEVIPFPYPPLFALPFQALSLLPLWPSYLLWTAINAAALWWYLNFFAKKIAHRSMPVRLLFVALACVPVFLNLLYGQLNIWLGICAGEFVRYLLLGKPQRAGWWLAGMLLKPQSLLLVVPILFVRRNWRALLGFALGASALGLGSLALAGVDGMRGLVSVVAGSAKGASASHFELMMNWRMLAWHAQSLLRQPWLGWAILLLGSLGTLAVLWQLLRAPMFNLKGQALANQPSASSEVILWLGVFAATGAVTWHAHFSMAIMLLPLLLLLAAEGKISDAWLAWWFYMPLVVLVVIFGVSLATKMGGLPPVFSQLVQLAAGVRGLALNCALLVWALRAARSFNRPKPDQ